MPQENDRLCSIVVISPFVHHFLEYPDSESNVADVAVWTFGAKKCKRILNLSCLKAVFLTACHKVYSTFPFWGNDLH